MGGAAGSFKMGRNGRRPALWEQKVEWRSEGRMGGRRNSKKGVQSAGERRQASTGRRRDSGLQLSVY